MGLKKIYSGPNGAPVQQMGGQETATTAPALKQHLKQKLKDTERRAVVTGLKNKMEVCKDLVGSKHERVTRPRIKEECLDPSKCHELEFEQSSNWG